jgi:hypothetical protein
MNRIPLTGPDLLRRIVANMDATNEGLNQQFGALELVAIYSAHLAAEWDLYPDQWTIDQLRAAAFFGEVPRWTLNGEPLPPVDRVEGELRRFAERFGVEPEAA